MYSCWIKPSSGVLVKAGDRFMFICLALSTLIQTASSLPTLVAQRVVLSLESIISDFFSIPAHPQKS